MTPLRAIGSDYPHRAVPAARGHLRSRELSLGSLLGGQREVLGGGAAENQRPAGTVWMQCLQQEAATRHLQVGVPKSRALADGRTGTARFSQMEAAPQDLGRQVIRGASWMLLTQAFTQIAGFVTAIVVARELGPHALGVAGEALVFASLALVVVDFGLGNALVQRPQLSDVDASTAFWASAGFGLLLTGASVAISWPIARLYHQPQVQGLFAVLSLAFLFTSLGIVQGALLTRELKFRTLQLRAMMATGASCLVAIILAVVGAGPWAIVGQDLTITSLSTIMLWQASPWRPRMTLSRESLRTITGFGARVFGARALDWGTQNCDNLLVGRFLGASYLGVYSIAFSIVVAPANRISTPIARVFFPAFSRMEDHARIAATWQRAGRIVALATVPCLLGLLAVAPEFVTLVFGRRWHAAIPVVQLLVLVGLGQALSGLNYGVLQAVGRPQLLLRYMFVASISTIAAFGVGLIWGLRGVATAYLAVSLLLHPAYLLLTARALGTSLRSWVRELSGVAEAGVGMLVLVLLTRAGLSALSTPIALRLALCIAVGAFSYTLLILWRAPAIKGELRVIRDRWRPASPAPEPAQ